MHASVRACACTSACRQLLTALIGPPATPPPPPHTTTTTTTTTNNNNKTTTKPIFFCFFGEQPEVFERLRKDSIELFLSALESTDAANNNNT